MDNEPVTIKGTRYTCCTALGRDCTIPDLERRRFCDSTGQLDNYTPSIHVILERLEKGRFRSVSPVVNIFRQNRTVLIANFWK